MSPSRRFSLLAALLIFFIFLLTVYLSRDFLLPVMVSVVLVFLLKPIFSFFFRKTGNKMLSSALSILAVVIVMLLVLLGATQALLNELSNIQITGPGIYSAQNASASQDLELWLMGKAQNASHGIELWLRENFEEPLLALLLSILKTATDIISALIGSMIASAIAMISDLPLYFAQSIVVLFFTFFMLFQGKDFANDAMILVPPEKKDKVWFFFQELDFIYTNIFTAYVFTALISGALAFIAFIMLNIPYPLVLAGVVVIFTFIPLVGAIWVFIPLALLYLLQGNYLLAAVLAVCGVVIFVIPQYFILPHLALKGGQIHVLITILAFIGPLFVLGLPGVIVGPILYGFLLAVYRTMVQEQNATQATHK
jgi:predicted PurR-regulated permease PerM